MTISLLSFTTESLGLLFGITIGLNVAVILLPLFFMKETPMHLLEKREREERFSRVLRYIRRINNGGKKTSKKDEDSKHENLFLAIRNKWETMERVNSLISKNVDGLNKSKKGIISLFLSEWRYVYQLVILTLVGGVINIVYFSVSMNISSITPGSFTTNGIIQSSVYLVSTLLILPISGKIKRRKALVVFQLIILAAALALALVGTSL